MQASHVMNSSHSLDKMRCHMKIKKLTIRYKKIKTYYINQLVKIVIVDEDPVFDHALEGLLIQVAGKRDRTLLRTSHHRHPKESRVEVKHVRNRRLPLVEEAPTINDFLGALRARSHCAH